jgi:hypothetical protein
VNLDVPFSLSFIYNNPTDATADGRSPRPVGREGFATCYPFLDLFIRYSSLGTAFFVHPSRLSDKPAEKERKKTHGEEHWFGTTSYHKTKYVANTSSSRGIGST